MASLLQQGNLISKKRAMKEIREQQDGDSGQQVLSDYPRTLKDRASRLLESTHCVDDEYVFTKEGEKTQRRIPFKNCFLTSLDYVSDPDKAIKAIKSLNKKRGGKPLFTTIPIYLINAHSSVEPRLILEPPDDMPEKQVEEEREYTFKDQLQAGFSLHIAPASKNLGFVARSDFFNTKANSNKFVISTAPIGYDAYCGDKSQSLFLKSASSDNFTSLRDILMSENFDKFFTANTKSSSLPWSDGHFQNVMFSPPGYSVVNKTYQFWDHDHSKPTTDKWGVIRLDTLTPSQIQEGAFDEWSPKRPNATLEERLACLHPLCDRKIRKILIDSIENDTAVSLKTITDKLGAGIYLDFGCSGLVLKIFDYENNRYITYSPDKKYEFMNEVLPFYNAIQESLEEITRYNKLSWNNIVSRKYEVPLNKRQKRLVAESEQFKKLTTTLQQASLINRASAEKNMGGTKKRKTKKSKSRKKRTRRSTSRKVRYSRKKRRHSRK